MMTPNAALLLALFDAPDITLAASIADYPDQLEVLAKDDGEIARFAEILGFAEDATGHEHPGPGPGGAQFVTPGGGGSSATKEKSAKSAPKLAAIKITGEKHLTTAQRRDLDDVFAKAGMSPKQITITPGYHSEFMAAVYNQTGKMVIAKECWDDNAREDVFQQWEKIWKHDRPKGFETVPSDLGTSFKDVVAHEMGHYFETIHGIPPIQWRDDPKIRSAAANLSGHTWRAVQDLDKKPWWPRGHNAEREIVADFFQAYLMGKEIPKLFKEVFEKNGANNGL
jgi:hypothetical protein